MTQKDKARCFGQDLMRGEHIVGGQTVSNNKVSPGGSPGAATRLQNGHTVRGDGAGKPMSNTEKYDPADGWRSTGLTFASGTPRRDEVSLKLQETSSGTSIFDPVLCELAYTWFCPPGGAILDPFAGGSVRGIVAAILGYSYTGADLSERQIVANEEQWREIAARNSDDVPVTVSGKWARHLFCCSMDYITGTCGGRCCEGADKILISLLPEEQKAQEEAGYSVKDGLLQADPKTGKCPHKRADGLCGVHNTPLKPFGCIASPFTLNDGDTLIIRNRYSMMKCHGQGRPAYETFRASLDLIFGEDESARICAEAEAGVDSIAATMPRKSYDALRYLDGLKHGQQRGGHGDIKWIVGDSREVLPDGPFDFVFSCPPYADLEVYSDDPRDISTMEYGDFLEAYRDIISKSVARLKDNRFACFVVGDVRDKKGLYRNFVGDTVAAFRDAGAMLYNDAVLVTAVGSLPIRAGRQFESGRKLGKTHQNVLVFVKGDWREATKACGDIHVMDLCGADEV